jgi:putative transposase
VVDTKGNLPVAWVTSVACHDGATAVEWCDGLVLRNELLAELRLFYEDNTFRSRLQAALPKYLLTICLPSKVALKKGPFCTHARRWVVEPTIAWTMANRLLARDYERSTRHAAA